MVAMKYGLKWAHSPLGILPIWLPLGIYYMGLKSLNPSLLGAPIPLIILYIIYTNMGPIGLVKALNNCVGYKLVGHIDVT